MSLKCDDHGWGIGELGCKACDAKNSVENPYSKATVQFGRMGEAAEDLRAAFMLSHYYTFQVIDPKDVLSIAGSVV